MARSKLSHFIRYFASFDQTIRLGAHFRVQAAVAPFYEDLVKFAKLGCWVKACPVKGYRVLFETRIPNILVEVSENWIPLKDIAHLPYSDPSRFFLPQICQV